jgi:protein required for attachment to host cells
MIIAAAPQALGTLRTAMSPQVRQKVIHEIAKDLTHIPNTEIGKHFEDVLAV